MAKQNVKEKSGKKKSAKEELLSLEPLNYKIILGGVVLIIIGYIALSAKPWDNIIALDIAPVLLVLGYCVVIPFGIIYRKKKTEIAADSQPVSQNIS